MSDAPVGVEELYVSDRLMITRDDDGVGANGAEQLSRPLSPQEEAVLIALITRGEDIDADRTIADEDRTRWLLQVPQTRAGRRCGCGTCPSIELTDTGGSTPGEPRDRVVVEASTAGALLLLHVDDDRLSYLELAPLDDETTFQDFPAAQSLHFGG